MMAASKVMMNGATASAEARPEPTSTDASAAKGTASVSEGARARAGEGAILMGIDRSSVDERKVSGGLERVIEPRPAMLGRCTLGREVHKSSESVSEDAA